MKSFRLRKRQKTYRSSSRPTDYNTRKRTRITTYFNKKHIFQLLSILLLFCVGSVASMVIYQKLCKSDFFRITNTYIKGCEHTNKTEILEQSGIDIHTNLLALDVSAVKSKLEEHIWVHHVDISRVWPNQLKFIV